MCFQLSCLVLNYRFQSVYSRLQFSSISSSQARFLSSLVQTVNIVSCALLVLETDRLQFSSSLLTQPHFGCARSEVVSRVILLSSLSYRISPFCSCKLRSCHHVSLLDCGSETRKQDAESEDVPILSINAFIEGKHGIEI